MLMRTLLIRGVDKEVFVVPIVGKYVTINILLPPKRGGVGGGRKTHIVDKLGGVFPVPEEDQSTVKVR